MMKLKMTTVHWMQSWMPLGSLLHWTGRLSQKHRHPRTPSPSEPSSSLPPLQAPPREPTRDKLDNIPAPPSTWGNPDENLELVPPASESSGHTLSSPGKIAEVAVSTPAGSLGEPAPSTPEQRPKLQKLPQFVIPGPEHERDLLKAQMDQQIAALRPGLGLERYCKRSNYISARGTNWP